jgi:hypothetical protein
MTCDARCVTAETTTCKAGDGCCPMGCEHATDSDCSERCGDGELADKELCEPGSAKYPCPSAESCDDHDPCTDDKTTGDPKQCSAACAHTPIRRPPINCNDGDPCTDDETVASATACIYECQHSPPRSPTGSCVDSDPCTDDTPVMSSVSCAVECPHRRMQPMARSCADSDPCTDDTPVPSAISCTFECPHERMQPTAQNCADSDPCTDDKAVLSATSCAYECPHSRLTPTGPTNCDDSNPCTRDSRVMSANSCAFECAHAPVANGSSCGAEQMCSSGQCVATPQRCGDGKTQGTEECDAGRETWECDRSCHRTRLYTACSSGSECRNGQGCLAGACTEVCAQGPSGFTCPSTDIPESALGVTCYLEEGDHGYCRPKCLAAADCPSGLTCRENVCFP